MWLNLERTVDKRGRTAKTGHHFAVLEITSDHFSYVNPFQSQRRKKIKNMSPTKLLQQNEVVLGGQHYQRKHDDRATDGQTGGQWLNRTNAGPPTAVG